MPEKMCCCLILSSRVASFNQIFSKFLLPMQSYPQVDPAVFDGHFIVQPLCVIILLNRSMFCTLSECGHTFQRQEQSRLILVVPLCADTAIFFCDDRHFYHYSLLEEKILYQSKLPGRVISAISISSHQILCTSMETKNLIILNIQEKSIDEICRLPLTKIYNETRQREVMTQLALMKFEKSRCFYLSEPLNEQNRTKVYFHPVGKENGKISADQFLTESFITKMVLLKKLDEVGKLVRFNQEIQENGHFKFITIDCKEKFNEKQFACRHSAFSRFAVVKEVKGISREGQVEMMLVFVNKNEPNILIVSEDNVQEYKYRSNKIFKSTVLINIELGYGMFMFMPGPDKIDPDYDSVVEVISLQTGTLHYRKLCNAHYIINSFKDGYLLFYRPENKPTNLSSFVTDHIISKKAHYMKLLLEKGWNDLSNEMMSLVLNQLE